LKGIKRVQEDAMIQSRMILYFAAFATTLLLLPGKVAAQWVYATSPDANLVSVIDPSHDTVARTILTPFSPGAIAVTADGQRAYVVNNCGAVDKTSGAAGTVTVLDLVNNLVLIPAISVGNCPSGIAIGRTANGVQAYVSNNGSDSISIIDVASNNVSKTIQLARYTSPAEVAFTADGKTVYVAGYPVAVIDTASYAVNTLGRAGFVAVDPVSSLPWFSYGPSIIVGSTSIFADCTSGPTAFMPSGGRAFVLDIECGEVYDVWGPPPTIKKRFSLGMSSYNQIAVASDGSRGYVGGRLSTVPTTTASAAAALSSSSVGGVTITNPGSGYTGAPVVTFYSRDVEAQGMTQTGHDASNPLGSVPWVSLTFSNYGGSGYLQPPAVQFMCQDYSWQCAKVIPATAVATISNGSVASVNVTNGGAGYINPPRVLFIRQGYTPAAGFATLSAGGVASVTVTNPGSGYGQPPAVGFVCGNAPASCGAGVVSFDPGNDTKIASAPLAGADVQGLAVARTPTPNTPPSNPPNSPVTVSLSNAPITVNFPSGITQAGFTGAAISSIGPSLMPNFQLSNPSVYYDIFTTAVYPAGSSIQVCIIAQGVTPNSKLMHFVGGSWVDVTTSVTPPTICGTDTSLSPFAVVQPANLDTIPPATTASVNPPPNAAGWNNTDVTVWLNSTDPDGTVLQITYSESGAQTIPQTTVAGGSIKFPITTEGATTVSFFATDAARNPEVPPNALVVQIDKTPPSVTYNGNAGKYTVDQTIIIQCTAVDPPNSNGTHGSGLGSSTCQNIGGPAYSFPVGNNTFSAQATDNAGNVGSGSTSFSVLVTYGSLCTLTKQFVESSAKYQALPYTLRSQIDQFVTSLCQQLTNAQLALTSQQKAQLIGAYQAGVSALVNNGWLTSAQGAILFRLSQAL
jgi:YVTN family beta-propeller protein